MSDEKINEISERYIELYEKITGESFVKADVSNIQERIEKNVLAFLNK
jgi:phosphoribosylaminoimidazole-succinocarboxamide synthase